MKQVRNVILSLIACMLLSSCSYYGTNYYLEPKKRENILCNEASLSVSGVVVGVDRSFYAFARIPYFPSLDNSNPLSKVDLSISFNNFDTSFQCKIDDVSFVDISTGTIYVPRGVWNSKVVQTDQGNYMSCTYTFGGLGSSDKYELRFRQHFAGCVLSPVQYVKTSEGGYHMVLVQ